MNDYIYGDCFTHLEKSKQKFDLILTSVPDMFEINMALQEYQHTFLPKVVKLVGDLIKDDKFVVFCQTDRKIEGTIFPKHIHIIEAMLQSGFILKDYKILLRSDIASKDLYRLTYSHVLFFTMKGKFKALEPEMKQHVLISKFPKNKNYWAEDFPTLIVRNLTGLGEIVLDPFAGRGTVLKCARDLGRQYLGFEIDTKVYREGVEYMGD